MAVIPRPCLTCGELTTNGPRCKRHTRQWGGRPDRRLRERVLARDDGHCWCGAAAVEVEHVVPWSEGGSDDPSNLRAVCFAHNPRGGRR